MEDWIPPAINGVFSIVVVVLGACFLNKREENRSKKELRQATEELRRADIHGQHQAVMSFLQTDRKSSGMLFHNLGNISPQRNPNKMNPADVLRTTRLRMLFFNDCLLELQIMNLGVHDLAVRRASRQLSKTCSELRTEYGDFLERYSSMSEDELPMYFKKVPDWAQSQEEYRVALKNLVEVARRQYRIKQ